MRQTAKLRLADPGFDWLWMAGGTVIITLAALITRGEETLLLHENESTYIPIGCAHRLENPGQLPLNIIEVQSGAYLGEDDIVRMDDVYGR